MTSPALATFVVESTYRGNLVSQAVFLHETTCLLLVLGSGPRREQVKDGHLAPATISLTVEPPLTLKLPHEIIARERTKKGGCFGRMWKYFPSLTVASPWSPPSVYGIWTPGGNATLG